MEQKEIWILFQGKRYLLIGNLEEGGAIATEEQYEQFKKSFAHLFPDGNIVQDGRVIGRKEDISVIEYKS